MSKSNPKEIIKIGLILFAITAVSALLLAFVNNLTAPVIAKNEKEKTFAAMASVMTEADNFNQLDVTENPNVKEAYSAVSADGEEIGTCVISCANGYNGEIKVLVGICDGKVTGVDILSQSETPGLGANAVNPDFKDQFIGKETGISAVKGGGSENDINAMSGATITSKAVTSAVNAALAFAEGGNKSE